MTLTSKADNVHTLYLDTPTPFDFRATCRSHGWIALVPFRWHEEQTCLGRVDHLPTGQVVDLEVTPTGDGELQILVHADAPLSESDLESIARRVRWMLRLDEDFTEFYALIEQHPRWHRHVAPGTGRLLRSPDLFEDVVKTICTTNISWSGTKRMVARLVERFGTPLGSQPDLQAFPTPSALAEAGEAALQEVGLGYRAAYVADLAQRVAAGELDLDAYKTFDGPVEELHRKLLALKGIGPYGAATLLMLLGSYEHLAIDSAMRDFVRTHYFDGDTPGDAEIRALYEPWGAWKYLAYWFDPGWEVV